MQIINDPILFGLVSIALTVLGAFAYRWRGMNRHDVPALLEGRQTRRLFCLVPIMIAAILIGLPPVWAIAILPLGWYGISQGHGCYMDLDTSPAVDNEFWRYLLDIIFGKIEDSGSSLARDIVGLSLTGLMVTVPIALLGYTYFYFTGILILPIILYGLVGFGKMFAYLIWRRDGTINTEYGEWGTGAVFAAGIPILSFLV